MPILSRWTCPIEEIPVATYLFGSPTGPLPTTPLLIDARRPEYYLSKATYRLWCQRLAAGLRANGLQKGDRVLLFSGNSCFFPVVILGTIMAGGIFTGANPTYTPRELAYQLTDSGAKFLITSEASVDVATAAAKQANLPESSVFLIDDGLATFEQRGVSQGNLRHWTHLVAPENVGKDFAWDDLSPEEVKSTTVTLNYSSGTTGVPKGVEITHKNYVANATQMEFQGRLADDYESEKKRSQWLCFLYVLSMSLCVALHLESIY
jgi:4-coumarate--CoA ligase